MTRIVTSTYRYKPPPRKRRKLAEITGPRIVTSADPKKMRRPATRRQATPQPTNDDGPRRSTVVRGKERPPPRPVGSGGQGKPPPGSGDGSQLTRLERAGQADQSTTLTGGGSNSSPPARKSAIVTVRDRKTGQRRREQQRMAELLADQPKRSAIVTARKPGKAIPDGLLPDTPEEHQRRGDAADAMFQDMKRRIGERRRR